MEKLDFEDTDAFYKALLKALKAGKAIEIITQFRNYSELPPKLKEILNLPSSIPIKVVTGELPAQAVTAFDARVQPLIGWVELATGNFVSESKAGGQLNLKALIIIASTAAGAAIGAGIGLFFGGIGAAPGAIAGGTFGLISGTVTVAMMSGNYKVEFEVDMQGRLKIRITPTKG